MNNYNGPKLRPRQARPEFQRPFPYPLITASILPLSTCWCSWGWSPVMAQEAGKKGPYVLKFFHSGCPKHSLTAIRQRAINAEAA